MSLADELRDRAESIAEDARRAERRIEGLEADIVRERELLRHFREQIVESRVAANLIEERGLRVWTDENGAPNVAVDEP